MQKGVFRTVKGHVSWLQRQPFTAEETCKRLMIIYFNRNHRHFPFDKTTGGRALPRAF
ncbi:unknown [Prevotella sp. CAG:1058]|nr:unknown [Prevotella sp. CAG:1058]